METILEPIIEFFELVITYLVEFGMLLTEFTGIAVLIVTFFKAFIGLLHRKSHSHLKLTLAKGIALSMEFMLVGEILFTMISREWHDIGILAAVIVIRIAVTFLLHWEIKQEEAEAEREIEAEEKAALADASEAKQG